MFHRVSHKAAHLLLHFRGGVQPVGAAHGKAAAFEVVAGPVPPDERGALHALIHPLLPREGDIVHHGVACPHHGDAFIQPGTEGAQEFIICPAAVVARGAHDEGLVHIRMLADEVFQNVVRELHLALSLADFAAGVIYQHAEIPHPQVVHLLQLGAKCVQLVAAAVFLPAHGVGRVNSPDKTHMIAVRIRNEVFQFCGFFLGVGFVAALAVVVGVVFRGVDVGVHLVAPHEAEDGAAGFKAPRCAVVAFHYAARGQVWPVYQNTHGQLAQLGYFAQAFIRKYVVVRYRGILHIVQHLDDGLPGIVAPGLIICVDGELAWCDIDGVAFRDVGQAIPEPSFAFCGAHEYLHLFHPGGDRAHAVVLRLGINDYRFGRQE